STLLTAILDAAGHTAGLLGTLGYRYHEHEYAGGHTTPEASDLFRILRRMRGDGAAAVAMEVSSHALAMGRVAGAEFDTAVFTNLTRDHLDYHKDFDDYFAAKRKLFDLLKPGARPAVNVDDHYGRQLAAEMPDAMTFGERGEVSARDVAVTATGTRGILLTPRGEVPFASPLLGRYNLSNLLAAAAGAETLGLSHDAVVTAFAASSRCRGGWSLSFAASRSPSSSTTPTPTRPSTRPCVRRGRSRPAARSPSSSAAAATAIKASVPSWGRWPVSWRTS